MTGYALTAEQKALLAISRTSWRRRGVAKARKLYFGEESITETVLMDLAETFPGQLEILPFNKNEEGDTGADWAWAISKGPRLFAVAPKAAAAASVSANQNVA
jgi:hypothetical protein